MASIRLKNVTLDFPIYGVNARSLRRQLVRLSTGGMIRQHENERVNVRAIDNLSLDIYSGEVIGVIGHNGAGKSSLLRVLSGIYEPGQGEVKIDGRVSTLLDLSLGMNDESTGYENIRMNGIIRYLTRAQIAKKQKEIDWRIVITSLVCLTVLEIYALSQGINGTIFTIVMVAIAAIAGITIPNPIKR